MPRPPTIARLRTAAAAVAAVLACTFTAPLAAQEPVPLSRGDLARMLEGGTYTPDEVAQMVRRACLEFRLTDDDLQRFRASGATEEVVEALLACREAPGASENGGNPAPSDPSVRLVLPDSVTARAGDTARVWGRVERQGEGAEGVSIVLETGDAGGAGGRRITAATSGPDGTVVLRVPAGPRPGRLDLRARATATSLAGSPGLQLIVRPAPVRSVDVRPEELLLRPDREAPLDVWVRLRDDRGNGLSEITVLLAPEAPPEGSSLARGVTDPAGEVQLSLPGARLRGVERLGVWARDSVLAWIPVRTDGTGRAGGAGRR